MRQRTLGSTGLQVSEIGLGAWQLGNETDWDGPRREESLEIVAEALRRGITTFDTAPGYAGGRSETILGEALADERREDLVIVSKFGHTDGWDADRIRPSIEGSLERLRTDHLDAVLLHNPPFDLHDGSAPHYAEFDRLRDEGLIRSYGVSLDDVPEFERVIDTTGSQVCEVFFNAFGQHLLTSMQRAAEAGIGLVIKVPLDSGWLSGRYSASTRFDDVRQRWSPEVIERRAALLERFEALLPDGVSTLHAALRFCLAFDCVSTVIPGCRSVQQTIDNAEASGETLPTGTVEAIQALWKDEIADDPLGW